MKGMEEEREGRERGKHERERREGREGEGGRGRGGILAITEKLYVKTYLSVASSCVINSHTYTIN